MAATMDEKGLEDAAILLMSLGEEEAAEVFKHLGPKEVQRLGETIARMKSVSRDRFDAVIDRFDIVAQDQNMLVSDTDEYVKSVLRKALGDDKANLLIDRILQGSDVTGIESLKWMDANSVAELLRNEHPQIMAAILVHLDIEQVAGILKHLNERTRNEVMLRIATLEGIQPAALRELNEAMMRILAGSASIKKTAMGGVIAHGTMSVSLIWQALEKTLGGTCLPHIELDIRFIKPVRLGDKLLAGGQLQQTDTRTYDIWVREERDEENRIIGTATYLKT